MKSLNLLLSSCHVSIFVAISFPNFAEYLAAFVSHAGLSFEQV